MKRYRVLNYLRFLKQRVSQKFDHGEYTEWKNKDFHELSQSVFQTTKVSISADTLKRVFGKNPYSQKVQAFTGNN